MHFTLPAAFLVFFFGLLIYIGVFYVTANGIADIPVTPELKAQMQSYSSVDMSGLSDDELKGRAILLSAQTALTTYFVLAGIMIMLFAQPPLHWFTGGAPYSGNKLPLYAAAALLAGYFILLLMPRLRAFFQLAALPMWLNLAIAAMTIIWMLVQRAAWRNKLLERFLDIDEGLSG